MGAKKGHPQPIFILGRTVFLLLMLAGFVYWLYMLPCIDGCGPYHNTSSVADLDGDGDLDVVVTFLRHETETTFWAGPVFWINEGGGKFMPREANMGGPSTAVGDLDGDGDPDLVQMDYAATLYIKQGGQAGDFKRGRSIAPLRNAHNWSTPGAVALGDLNGDDRLDVIVGYCCSLLITTKIGEAGFFHFLPFAWINRPDGKGRLEGESYNLTSLGDLPMRPTLGDLDGDGDLDVYAASQPPKGADYDSTDRVLLNDGSGNFVDSGQRLHNSRLSGAASSGAVALEDLDGDGDLDALVSSAVGAAIWINQSGLQAGQAGIFEEYGQRIGRGPIEAVFLADLDGDGDPDALVAGNVQASIWWNDGMAGFHDSGQRMRYTKRHGLAVADFDGDGDIDLFAAAYGDTYSLWLNRGDGSLLKAGI